MNKEIQKEIEEQIWIIQETAKNLKEFLELHGEKVMNFEQLFNLKLAVTETMIKYEKIGNSFENKNLKILNLNKEKTLNDTKL